MWPSAFAKKKRRLFFSHSSYAYLHVKLVLLNTRWPRLTWRVVWLAQMLLSECGRHLLREAWHWTASSQPILQFPESRWKEAGQVSGEPLTPPQQGRADRLRDGKRNIFTSSFPLTALELQLTDNLKKNYQTNSLSCIWKLEVSTFKWMNSNRKQIFSDYVIRMKLHKTIMGYFLTQNAGLSLFLLGHFITF